MQSCSSDQPLRVLVTHFTQMLWAAVSGCDEGVRLLMECGCDAVAAKAWFSSFDVMHKAHSPKRQAMAEVSSNAAVSVRVSSGTKRRAMVPMSSSTAASVAESLKLLGRCIEECGNFSHGPMVAQLYTSESFASPPLSDIKWTSRVRGVSMQVTAAYLNLKTLHHAINCAHLARVV